MLGHISSRRLLGSSTRLLQAVPSSLSSRSYAPFETRKIQQPRVANAFATEAVQNDESELSDYEKYLSSKLLDAFTPSQLSVKDISGGCGSMFAIDIVSKAFKGIPMIKQHRMVNEVLSDEIKQWHGVQLKTKAE